MKKVLLTGVALMLAGGVVAPVFAADATPGISITGDARARYYYKSEEYFTAFGNPKGAANAQTNMDSRIRFNLTGTTAGGAYIMGRIRMMENTMGDFSQDVGQINNFTQNNIWADKAYFGVPFSKEFTLEVGKYRSTYGPLPLTNNFFYDDVNLTGARGIVKIGDIEINPFFEYMTDSNNSYANATATNGTVGGGSTTLNNLSTGNDAKRDHDEIRMGAHAKAKLNKDWTVGGMLGYQTDQRDETPTITKNEGAFGSVYTNGKAGAFGLVGELAFTADKLNGFNNWREDYNESIPADAIGSRNTGWGGYVFPNYTIDKLNLGVNIGFTASGFLPDRAFGFVMLGTADNSVISAQKIGETGDWFWAGFVPSYTFNDSLKLTGNLVYASISNNWTAAGDGPGFTGGANKVALSSAWELSAVLQYTILKGANVFFAVGYLDPSLKYVNQTAAAAPLKDDAALGGYTRFELAF
jgi:hypothetical protein